MTITVRPQYLDKQNQNYKKRHTNSGILFLLIIFFIIFEYSWWVLQVSWIYVYMNPSNMRTLRLCDGFWVSLTFNLAFNYCDTIHTKQTESLFHGKGTHLLTYFHTILEHSKFPCSSWSVNALPPGFQTHRVGGLNSSLRISLNTL